MACARLPARLHDGLAALRLDALDLAGGHLDAARDILLHLRRRAQDRLGLARASVDVLRAGAPRGRARDPKLPAPTRVRVNYAVVAQEREVLRRDRLINSSCKGGRPNIGYASNANAS